MMTAQAAPWFTFALQGRVPADHFSPRPSVDGGILSIARRRTPLVPVAERRSYEQFVGRIFTGRGRGMGQRFDRSGLAPTGRGRDNVLRRANVDRSALPRDLTAEQWSALWSQCAVRRA